MLLPVFGNGLDVFGGGLGDGGGLGYLTGRGLGFEAGCRIGGCDGGFVGRQFGGVGGPWGGFDRGELLAHFGGDFVGFATELAGRGEVAGELVDEGLLFFFGLAGDDIGGGGADGFFDTVIHHHALAMAFGGGEHQRFGEHVGGYETAAEGNFLAHALIAAAVFADGGGGVEHGGDEIADAGGAQGFFLDPLPGAREAVFFRFALDRFFLFDGDAE